MRLNYEISAAAAALFSTKRDFREKANREYQWLQRNDLLVKACAHMNPLYRSFSDDDVAEIARKYTGRREFKLGDQSAYQAARKRGILDAVCAHMQSDRYRYLSDAQIAEIALRFTSRGEFAKEDHGAYQTASRRGILDAVSAHMDVRETRRLADAEILEIARKYATRNDFKLNDFGAYTTAFRRGLIDEAFAHMEYGFCGFREDKPANLYQFRVELPGGLVLYKVGITNRKPRQRLVTMGLQRGAKVNLTHCLQFEYGRDARMAEKRLHKLLAAHRHDGERVLQNGNTELFTVPAFKT